MKEKILILILPFLVAACGGLQSKQPPPELYMLHPVGISDGEAAARTGKVVIVPEPQVPPGFKTDQIALFMQGGRRFDYFANARWPADLDRVLQEFIIQSLRKAWPHTVVATPDAGTPASWRLMVKVVDFEPVYKADPDSAPEIRMAMTFTLVTLPDGKIKKDFTISRKVHANANAMTAIVTQMEMLLQDMLREAAGRIRISE